jgi:nucleoside-diphosphate kinase
MQQRTLSMIKPDATQRNLTGKIISKLEGGGLKIVAAKMLHLSKQQAGEFYVEHKDKVFYNTLIENMIAATIIVQVLQAEDAIALNRKIMGSTDPETAETGTVRKDFAISMQKNSVHGSDSVESAAREIAFFFNEDEIFN